MHALIVGAPNSEDDLNACAVCPQPMPTIMVHEDPDK
jgi:hypothetical protein